MFFHVHSGNRHAVRRLLTATGIPSTEVRLMKNGALGKQLQEFVTGGKVTEEQARTACAEVTPVVPSTIEGHFLDDEGTPSMLPYAPSVTVPAAQTVTVPAANAQDAVTALQALMSALTPKGGALDEAVIRGIVAEQLAQQASHPAIIEIKCGDATLGKLAGGTAHAKFETVLKTINARIDGRRLHVWLVGPSGSGKSYLASQVAKASNLPYYSTAAIQSKYELVGYQSPTGAEGTLQTPFRKAFEQGGVFAWDDIDASDPRAFVAFNEALANGRFAFPDRMVDAHPDFVTVASANTWGTGATADYVGRNKIDAATLTRFVRISIDYDERLEAALVGAKHNGWCKFVQNVRKAVQAEGIKVLITPRHTLQGAALAEAGMHVRDIEQMTVFAGLDDQTVTRLRRAA